MKRVLSIALCVMMLSGIFVMNASAAIPTESFIDTSVTEAAVTTKDTFEDLESIGDANAFDWLKYDATTSGIVSEDAEDENSNKVFDLKFSNLLTFEEDGTTVKTRPAYNNVQLTQKDSSGDVIYDWTIPETYMVEFDVCAIDNSTAIIFTRRCDSTANGHNTQTGVGIDPDSMVEGTWYTYRIYMDESGYRSADSGNPARTAFLAGAKAYRKVRGSGAPFEDVTSTLIDAYCSNGPMGFALNAGMNYLADGEDTTSVKIVDDSNASKTYYPAALSANYQLDNIGVYSYTVPTEYNINTGVLSTYALDDATSGESVDARYGTLVYTAKTEEGGNGYVELSIKDIVKNTVGFWGEKVMTTDAAMSEKFVLSFDAMNTAQGLALTFEVYTELGESETKATQDRRRIFIGSNAEKLNQWYSYRLVCDKGNDDETLDVVVYSRPCGSNGAWTQLTSGTDVKFGTTASSGASRANKFRMGFWGGDLASYSDLAENAKAVWCVDNIQITEEAAVTGTVSAKEGTVSAKINVSAAALACDPIVAVFDGERFVNVASATVNSEGFADITVENYTEGNTVKLFVWESLSAGAPIMGSALDITDLL